MSETTLHRQLKSHYADEAELVEQRLGRFRIDVVRGNELIEIQHGSLAAIRRKIATLLDQHVVRVVKPLILRKHLIKRSAKGRRIVDRRLSPKRGTILDLFEELIYFRQVFPHPRLILDVPLVTIEEWRYPGHGRRRWRHARDHQVEDQRLVSIDAQYEFRSPADLAALINVPLPTPFTTRHLSEGLAVSLPVAQKMVYVLRGMEALSITGKLGNSRLYAFPTCPSPRRKKNDATNSPATTAAGTQRGAGHERPSSI